MADQCELRAFVPSKLRPLRGERAWNQIQSSPFYEIRTIRAETTMGKSDDLRKNAENCIELADAADSVQKKIRYVQMAKSWNSLADTQSWLDGEKSRGDTDPEA
jgi:hypothetical protein